MEWTVVRPTTRGGHATSTRGSFAVRAMSASSEMPMPGTITPPAYSPLAVTTSNVVAVPKSTTIEAPLMRSVAATALAMRSAPTSFGLSYRIGTPVRTPGPTTSGSWPKSRRHNSSMRSFIGGTTLPRTMPRTAGRGLPPSAKTPRRTTTHSSTVRAGSVRSRQCTVRLAPS